MSIISRIAKLLGIGGRKVPGKGSAKQRESSGSRTKSHFFLRERTEEELTVPVHIDFESFEPSFGAGSNAASGARGPMASVGTFLVTLNSPNFGPMGLTCRVSGINHRLTQKGVVGGLIANVNMVKDLGEGPIERVHVALYEDGRVIGHKEGHHGQQVVDLNEVYFSYGDTVFLDGDGYPFDEQHKPQPTKRQREFCQDENEKMAADLLDSILNR